MDIAKFKLAYPQFKNLDNAVIEVQEEIAQCFFSFQCAGECSEMMLFLLVAHLLHIQKTIDEGGQIGRVQSATVDKVSVTYATTQGGDNWSDWLGATPYGSQFLALFRSCNVGGFYVGGNPEGQGFNKVYGLK